MSVHDVHANSHIGSLGGLSMPKVVGIPELTRMLCDAITSSGTREVGSTIELDLLPLTGTSALQPLDRDEREVDKICTKLAEDHLKCGALPPVVSGIIVNSFAAGNPGCLVADLVREVHKALVQGGVILAREVIEV